MLRTVNNIFIAPETIESCKFDKTSGVYVIKADGKNYAASRADVNALRSRMPMVPAEAGTWTLDPKTGDRIAPVVALRADGQPILGDPEVAPVEMPDGRVMDADRGVFETYQAWRASDD